MWNSSSENNSLKEGAWAEWDPELESMQLKAKYPYHLTIFAFFSDEHEFRPASDDEQLAMHGFQESVLAQLLPKAKAVIVGRCWHSNLVRLEYRVQDPDKVDAKLRTILFKKKHSFSLDYQIFSDANWEVPQGYWNGDIVFEMQAEMDDHMVGDFMPELSDSPLGEPSRANLTEDRFEVSVKRELESVKQRLEYAKGKARIPLWVRLVELTANDHRMRSAGVALLKAALIEYPNNPDLVRILAAVLIREKVLGDARFFLYRVLEKNDGIPELYYHLACAEALANRPFEAIGALESALILNPFYAENAASDPNLASLRFRSDFRKLTSLAVC